MRKSTVATISDSSGSYEVEIFDHPDPKIVIVCVHGNGARRWDGEDFYYAVADHYADSAVMLVDQNQIEKDGVKLNPLPVLVKRVQGLVSTAKQQYPNIPVVIFAHSMGCGVVTQLDLKDVAAVFFVAPADGTPQKELIEKYGPDIVNGKNVLSSEGQKRIIPAEYFTAFEGINWENEYVKLVKRYSPIYVYEAGDDEILDERRFAHRDMPFTSYEIIQGAKHNFSGQPLADLFQKIDIALKNLSH